MSKGTLLALLGEEPAGLRQHLCSEDEEESEGERLSTLSELRPAIRRWYSASPRQVKAKIAAILLQLRGGKPVQDRSIAQSIARAMQSEFSRGASPLMQSLLENWSEDTDTGILEQILGSMTSRDECKAAQQALHQLREMRQGHKSDRGAVRQQTLMQAWAKAVRDPTGATSSRDLDDPDTAHIRHRLERVRRARQVGHSGAASRLPQR